ncbi:imm11 family protein [Parasphingorhabdus cellanae]|uniref:Immunity MXAN-0049 protein domain-containing protein n=1 Tax=Parasphingorhabdus cellanae TaxID=2806553 RepID=A0ABX7T6U1_9SPHN|nr:DUF1629 domain-containing protein [Parasphingorhabdus cellanae]QTD56512.1 hypothetical protein J4G78_02635 [Parasphingorhabdus cellanae]
MVWGMSLPSGFGEFFPMGNFEAHIDSDDDEWGDRLKAYYKEKMSEEQKALFDDGMGNGPGAYSYYVAQKFISERGMVSGVGKPPFCPIEAHEPPRSFVTEKGYKSLGSLIMLNGRILAVDEALKTIIERLEPGEHEFSSIEVRMPRNKVYPSSYYTLFIGQYFDSFLPEKSKRESIRNHGPSYPNYYSLEQSKKGVTGLALAKATFGSAHLWRERAFREWLICFSDELQAEIAEGGLRIPKHYQIKQITETVS